MSLVSYDPIILIAQFAVDQAVIMWAFEGTPHSLSLPTHNKCVREHKGPSTQGCHSVAQWPHIQFSWNEQGNVCTHAINGNSWWMLGFWVVTVHCYTVGYREELKTWSGKVVREAAKVLPSKRQICNPSLQAGDLFPWDECSLLIYLLSVFQSMQECTCSSCYIRQLCLLLNCALASFNLGAFFWSLALDPVEMGTDLTRTYKDRVTGEENPWATPLPISPYHKP